MTQLAALPNHSHSGYATTTSLANYLPLTGGGISSNKIIPLDVNSTSTAGIGFELKNNNNLVSQFGWSSRGTYIYDYTSNSYLGITNTGTPFFNTHELLHADNYYNYALPKTGGNLGGPLRYGKYLAMPNAQYSTSGDVVGCIKIKIPTNPSNAMLSFWIDVFNYSNGTSYSAYISGYTFNDNNWYQPTTFLIGNTSKIVKYGHDGTNFIVCIGLPTDTHSYPNIIIRDVLLGHQASTSSFNNKWNISITNDISDINFNNSNECLVLNTTNYTTYCASVGHTHSYLPLSGGTITSTEQGIATLMLNSIDNSGHSVLQFANKGTYLGALGFSSVDTPYFRTSAGAVRNLIHSGNIGSQSVASATTATNANSLYITGVGYSTSWNWSGKTGTPDWVWGGTDGTNMYVYKPANFSVNHAEGADYAVRLISPYSYEDSKSLKTSDTADSLFGKSYMFSAMMQSDASLFGANEYANVLNFSGYQKYGATQFAVKYNKGTDAAIRAYVQNAGWSPWKFLAFKDDIPTSLPANGGNADTLDGYHHNNFAKVFSINSSYTSANDIPIPYDNQNSFQEWHLPGISYNGIIQWKDYGGNWGQIMHIYGDNKTLYYRGSRGDKQWRQFAFTEDIPTSLPANGGNADTVGGVGIANLLSFSDYTNYVAARFNIASLNKLAAEKYIEFWGSNGWYNSKWGKVTAEDGFIGNLTGDVTGSATNASQLGGIAAANYIAPATYNTKSGQSGYYLITINSTEAWMLAFRVRVYKSYTYQDIRFSGYNYGDQLWYSPIANIVDGDADASVHFGYTSPWNLYVAIPAGNYTGIEISDVVNGYSQVNKSIKDLFTITNVSSLPGTIQCTYDLKAPANKYAEKSHTHSNYYPKSGGSLTGNVLSFANGTELYNESTTSFAINKNSSTRWVTINDNGVSAKNFITTSDRRMKENIKELQDCSKSLELNFYEFDYKTGGHSAGHIAQEVKEVLPEFVHEDKDEEHMLSIDYTGLHSVQIKALIDENNTMKKEIKELKELIKTLINEK